MKKMKKVLSLILVFAMVLTIIPAASVQAKKTVNKKTIATKAGTIKKTTKKKYVIKKFDDQDFIDLDEEISECVAFINERGGWYGITEDYTWKLDKKKNYYVPKYKDGVYLDPNSLSGIRPKMQDTGSMTIAQAARSLKNMYGKYSCVTKAELASDDEPLTTFWIEAKLMEIARKRHNDAFADLIGVSLKRTPEKGWNLSKAGYAYYVANMMRDDVKGIMDPMYDHDWYKYD